MTYKLSATAATLYTKLPPQMAMIVENAVYQAMNHTCPDYNGGTWNMSAKNIEGKVVLKAIFLGGDKTLVNSGAQTSDEVNGRVSGAVCLTMALNALCHKYHGEGSQRASRFLADLYYQARDAAMDAMTATECGQFLSLTD